jgi:hypothetical protein
MKLRIARLCLDCEEIHDAQECPICASEAFAYLTRWVPVPDGGQRPTPAPTPVGPAPARVDRVKRTAPAAPSSKWRLLVPGVLGAGVLGLAGWLWRGGAKDAKDTPESPQGGGIDAGRDAALPGRPQPRRIGRG